MQRFETFQSSQQTAKNQNCIGKLDLENKLPATKGNTTQSTWRKLDHLGNTSYHHVLSLCVSEKVAVPEYGDYEMHHRMISFWNHAVMLTCPEKWFPPSFLWSSRFGTFCSWSAQVQVHEVPMVFQTLFCLHLPLVRPCMLLAVCLRVCFVGAPYSCCLS